MEKIITLQYQGRTFQISEEAHKKFHEYEATLKNHFLKEEGGDEIFMDLQHRMAEILEQKSKNEVISSSMIDELISIIGKPSDLGNESSEDPTPLNSTSASAASDKKLYRDSKEKILGGVCSGIANYFAVETIAVRLIFVLITLFNVASLFKLNLAIIAYIILWAVLTPKPLTPNVSKKLFRNAKDRVIGGVCSGIAHFFNTETWIVRLIFVSPIIISILSGSSHHNFNLAGNSLGSITFISYIILWFITPLAKASTDYMLLKGEPININTIQSKASMNLVANKSNNGLNKVLKIIAYIFMAIIAAMLIPALLGILTTSIFAYSISEMILFTDFNKTMAILAIATLCITPIIAFFIWIARRVAGYKSQSKTLRTAFMGLIGLGLISGLLLTISLFSRMHTFVKRDSDSIRIPTSSDTLIVDASVADNFRSENLVFDWNLSKVLLQKTETSNKVRAVRFNYEDTEDSNFSYSIKLMGAGAGTTNALNNLASLNYQLQVNDNKLMVDPFVTISKSQPYNLQNASITVYVPKGKTIIIKRELRNQLNHNIKLGNKNWNITHNNSNHKKDKVYTNGTSSEVVEVNGDWDEAKEEVESISKEEKKKRLEETMRKKKELIEERKRELEDAKREQEQIIQEKQRELEEVEREQQRMLKEKERELNKALKEI